MIMDDLLDETVEYANMLIEVAVQQDSAESLGTLCNEISRYYRAMGIYDLLMHANTDGLYYGLIQSGLTRKYYLERCVQENVLDDPERRSSFADPFFDAVAADQFTLAAEIAQRSPAAWMEGYEYEDDFAYARFFYDLVGSEGLGPEPLQATLHQLEQALEGQPSERLALCEALLVRDQDGFDRAFTDLLNAERDKVDALADPIQDSVLAQEYTFQANRWVFVEGLAILRVAERLGLQTESEYDRCPSVARLPAGKPFTPESFPNLSLH